MAIVLGDCSADWVPRKKSLRLAALIRTGKWCKDCTGNTCADVGRKSIECVSCRGAGCELCERGQVWVNDCPHNHLRPIAGTLQMIDMADKGHLPVGGGVLDQSQWFISAYEWFTRDVKQIEADG